MSNVIFYATRDDVRVIHDWINAESDVAWIVKVSETNHRYRWQAVFEAASDQFGAPQRPQSVTENRRVTGYCNRDASPCR
jgi:hypothetical protein